MGFTEWFEEQDASVAIAAILAVFAVGAIVLVAFAVVFAAVLGTFVLDIGASGTAGPPQADFVDRHDDGSVTVIHVGGESVEAARLVVTVDDDRTPWSDLDPNTGAGDFVQEGDAATIEGVDSGDTVRIVYVTADEEHVLLAFEVP